MNTKTRGYRLRIEDSPGVPVTFGFGVKPVWVMVMPVVKFATLLTSDEIKIMTSVMMRI
jgi:hypothetical protein